MCNTSRQAEKKTPISKSQGQKVAVKIIKNLQETYMYVLSLLNTCKKIVKDGIVISIEAI